MTKLQQFPACLALLIQCFSLIVIIASASLVLMLFASIFHVSMTLPFAVLVLMQASVAAIVAHFVGMASWWRWIHFGFPIAVYAMLKFNLPNELYLIGFLMTLGIFWTTFRTQVPYYPSRLEVWQQMSAITQQLQMQRHSQIERQPLRIIDIGSGLGGLSLYLAKSHTNIHVSGIEIAPLPWLVSKLRAMLQGSNATFTLGNYHALNFADYDIVFAYLSPAAMQALWNKATKEMKINSLLVSLEFEIPNVMPTQRIVSLGQSPDLYVFQIGPPSSTA